MALSLAHRLDEAIDKRRGLRPIDATDQDAELVARFRAGERAAFDLLVKRHQRPVYYMALRYVRNEADAKDVTQRVFVRAYGALHKFRGSSSFRTWLYRISINLSLNHIRDHRRERPVELSDDILTVQATGAGRLIASSRSRQLRDAIADLPPKQRMVLELRIYEELSFREVAELANCSENAAKVNFHHAVKRLKRDMGGHGESDT